MAIEFSREVEDNLLEVFLYGIEEQGLNQVERHKARFDQILQTLSDNPKITFIRLEITPHVGVYPAQKHMIAIIEEHCVLRGRTELRRTVDRFFPPHYSYTAAPPQSVFASVPATG